MAKEKATRAHDGSMKLGLPRGHSGAPDRQVHAQIVAVEPDPILAKEDVLNGITYTQTVAAKPDAILVSWMPC